MKNRKATEETSFLEKLKKIKDVLLNRNSQRSKPRNTKHTLKLTHWESNKLIVDEFFLDSLEQALEHSKHFHVHHIKIYNGDDELVYSDFNDDQSESYS